jgi:predicted component of type VI protein secretion system
VTGFVLVEERPSAGKRHVVDAGTTIGREDCEITLTDTEVSRRHARVRALDDTLAIEDLGSTNGTYVNGERITGLVELQDGDTIKMGNSELRLEVSRDADPATRVRAKAAIPPAPAAAPAPARPAATPPAPAAAPEPARPAATPAEPAAARQSTRRAAAQAAPGAPAAARGDVPPPPPLEASRVHGQLTPVAAPPQTDFAPGGTRSGRRKGSAATRVEATVACYGVVLTTTAAVAVYLAQR